MNLPDCYLDSAVTEPFFKKAKEYIPFLAYFAIQSAFAEKDKMFKVVALTHLRNHYKKGEVSRDQLNELIEYLDTFRDPYQDFYEKAGFRTWKDTKNNILGGLLNESCRK
ncbi:hypothetical protein MKY20_25195 [Cytobacillus sp. FSL W8-0315]|uniref:hypothetical protein n=1 Tax=Cytobacillus sp. FSL W8-0315 TaxID=2921600 RepID=UPI0030F83C0F